MFTKSLIKSRALTRVAFRPFSKVQPNQQEVEAEDESASSIYDRSESEQDPA
jgi:hypothetical protein